MTNKTASRVSIVTQYFYPSTQATAQLATEIAVQLKHLSYDVEVITSTPGPRFLNNIPVYRSNSFSPNQNHVLNKIFSGAIFSVYAAMYALLRPSSTTTYLLFSNPPFICTVFGLLAILRSIKYVFVYQDLFPQSAVISGILPAVGPLTLFWQVLMNFGCTRAATVIVLNPSMKRRLLRYSPWLASKISVIHNWSVSSPVTTVASKRDFRTEWNAHSDLVLLYSGNLGRLHDIITFLESARLLLGQPIKFIFCGHGPKINQVIRYIAEYNLTNVVVQSPVPLDDLRRLLSASDIALMSIVPGAESLIAPSKLYGILATGKPVFYVGGQNSDISMLVRKSQCGKTFSNGESVLLSRELLTIISNKGLLESYSMASYYAYSSYFGFQRSILKYQEVF